MDTPRGPRAPQGSHGHKPLGDLLENREQRGKTHPNPAVMDLSAQGWSWGVLVTPVTSQCPVGEPRVHQPGHWARGRQGQEGSQECQSPGLGCRAGRGSVGHSTTVLSIPGSFRTVPCSKPCPDPRPAPQGGSHSLGSPQRDPGAAQEPQEPGGSRAEQSSLTQAAYRENPAPTSSWEPS